MTSYILIVLFNKGNLSFDGGGPFFRGYENKIDFLQALNFSTEEPYKGYVLLKKCNAMPMLMYNPLYGLQKKNLEELSKQSSSSAKFRIAGVGFEIEKRTETVFDMNGTVVDDTYQGETVDTSYISSLHDTKYQDVCEFISDIYAIKEFTYFGESFYCLEIEVLSQIENDGSGLRINLYVNKSKLGNYVPQVGDNITGFMWLSAYLSTDNIPEAQDKVYGSGVWAKVKRFLFG